MKQGFSFGKCIRDIVNGVVAYDEVLSISARTDMRNEEDVEEVIQEYLWRPSYLMGLNFQECLDVGLRLYREGKVDQPRQRGEVYSCPANVVWMDVAPAYPLPAPLLVEDPVPMSKSLGVFSTGLTLDQQERLDLLAEECAEVIQVAMKIKRHGYESHHPDRPDQTNRKDLSKELGHLMNAIRMMLDRDDIAGNDIYLAEQQKFRTIGPYLHHQ